MNTDTSKKIEAKTYSSEYVDELVVQASDLIAPAWSLKKFVASNPLQGLENLNFERASSKAQEYFETSILPNESLSFNAYNKGDFDLELLKDIFSKKVNEPEKSFKFHNKEISKYEFLENSVLKQDSGFQSTIESSSMKKFIDEVALVNEELFPKERTLSLVSDPEKSDPMFFRYVNSSMIRWLERFYDEGQASIEMPNREKGLFAAWKELAVMKDLSKEQKQIIADLPSDSAKAIVELYSELGIEEEDWEEYARLSLLALPGWASYIKWRMDYQGHMPFNKIAPPSLKDYLALRLALEKVYSLDYQDQVSQTKAPNKDSRAFIEWLFSGLLKVGYSKSDILAINLKELERFDSELLELYLKKGMIFLETIEATIATLQDIFHIICTNVPR